MPVDLDHRNGALAWGRVHKGPHTVVRPRWLSAARELACLPTLGKRLAFGLGRSYGDSCLNIGGSLIDTARLDRVCRFDRQTGQIVVEAGFTLFDLLNLCARRNPDGSFWFPAVLPGTKFVTVGGAIANDIHGKNHYLFGTFGRHVEWLELARSDGSVLRCAPDENGSLFAATVGGLGLTGLVTRAGLRLRRVEGLHLEVEDLPMRDLRTFFHLANELAEAWEYTVAWIDCLAEKEHIGRGIFSRARHLDRAPDRTRKKAPTAPRLSIPYAFPGFALNAGALSLFNAIYRARQSAPWRRHRVAHYDGVLFPLDAIGNWNLLYGARGFYQFQCVVPQAAMEETTHEILARIAAARQGSFLTVLKTFGALELPGLLSFPMEGATIALDFPNRGRETLALLEDLDGIVTAAGGRIYPAKDGRMTGAAYRRQYSNWEVFARHIDPQFSSSFWRRLMENAGAAST